MTNFDIRLPGLDFVFPMIFIKGTGDGGYQFGAGTKLNIRLNDFFLSRYLVTQQLWEYLMKTNHSADKGMHLPADTVSYNDITCEPGFLTSLNNLQEIKNSLPPGLRFRLPSESEWEYAARGGIHWQDGFQFSGSNDIDQVGWFEDNAGKISDPVILRRLKNTEKGTKTHEVGQKQPNQLGLYDMSGNAWEWCEDYFHEDVYKIPPDGTACQLQSQERVLRGGCHHNWAVHCTVYKRYAIAPDFADGCIGFRIAASFPSKSRSFNLGSPD